MAYIFIFLTTLSFIFLLEKVLKSVKLKTNLKLIVSIILGSVCIFIPCFFAGIRDSKVGIDVEMYLVPAIINAKNKDFSSFLHSYNNDYGFYLLIYVLSKFNSTYFLSSFILQFLSIFPVFLIAIKYKDKISITVVFFVYLFLFYNFSLCLIRQIVACSFSLLGFVCLYEKKYLKYIICCIIAFLFHNTSLIFNTLVLVFMLFTKKKLIATSLIIISSFILLFFSEFIIEVLLKSNIIDIDYYDRFVERIGDGKISIGELIVKLLISFITVMPLFLSGSRDKLIYCKNEFSALVSLPVFISLFGINFIILNSFSTYFYRIGIYFNYFTILCVPAVLYIVKNKKLFLFSCLSLIMVNWVYIILMNNYFGTLPYLFS